MDLFYLVPVFGIIALIYTFVQSAWVSKQNAGNDRMKEIAGHISDGAMALSKCASISSHWQKNSPARCCCCTARRKQNRMRSTGRKISAA